MEDEGRDVEGTWWDRYRCTAPNDMWRCKCKHGFRLSPKRMLTGVETDLSVVETSNCGVCSATGDPCECEQMFTMGTGRVIVHKVAGTCVLCGKGEPGGPDECFSDEYEKFVNEHWSYRRACEEANRRCATHKACNPCGPGTGGLPQISSGIGACLHIKHDVDWLNQQCGPHGADKLAHCYAVCIVSKCSAELGNELAWFVLWINEVFTNDDPADHQANAAGYVCAMELSRSCLECCDSKTKGLEYW